MNEQVIVVERTYDDSIDGIARLFEILIRRSQEYDKQEKEKQK